MNYPSLIKQTKYSLSTDQQILIQNMSNVICEQKRDYFVSNFKRDKTMSLHEMNLNGFGAELAFCTLIKADFDSSTKESDNHYSRMDCTLSDGRTVDVKNTIYEAGRLIVRTGKESNKVDIFVLMTGKFPDFTFKGWATYSELINNNNLMNLGSGFCYVLNQNQLRPSL